MKRSNVALFVPHNGCPKQCSFCNQKEITGCTERVTQSDVEAAAETALKSGYDMAQSEIAFFGGSFTGIEPEYMKSLLEAAYSYVSKGLFKGIRISTRPDYISQDILNTLKAYGVTSIELGAQSMDDGVLKLNLRGHSADDVVKSSELIKKNGFSLGLQMMTGLYGSDDEKDIFTARRLIELKPDTIRIYPTIALKNTRLGELCLSGEYKPQTLKQAVELCSRLIVMFNSAGIKIIRLGLHDSESLRADYISGPYHPAFRELCESRIFLNKIIASIDDLDCGAKKYTVHVSPRNISKAVGQKRKNIEEMRFRGIEIKIIPDDRLENDELRITPVV